MKNLTSTFSPPPVQSLFWIRAKISQAPLQECLNYDSLTSIFSTYIKAFIEISDVQIQNNNENETKMRPETKTWVTNFCFANNSII